jgi:sulfite exporter TauE/SafE
MAHAAYHAGRLASYLSLGAVAGLVGAGLETAGGLAGVQRFAAVVAGALMVIWGGALLLEQRGLRLPRPAFVEPAARRLGGVLVGLRDQAPPVRAGAMGLLTTLLPCGWLWAFLATAAGTGSVAGAMLLMTVFWAGSLPALLAVGVGATAIAGPLRRHLPALSAIALIAVGAMSLAMRVPRIGLAPGAHGAHAVPAAMHSPSATAATSASMPVGHRGH